MILKILTRNDEEIIIDDVLFFKFTGDTFEVTSMKTERAGDDFVVGTHIAKFPISLISLFTIEEKID